MQHLDADREREGGAAYHQEPLWCSEGLGSKRRRWPEPHGAHCTRTTSCSSPNVTTTATAHSRVAVPDASSAPWHTHTLRQLRTATRMRDRIRGEDTQRTAHRLQTVHSPRNPVLVAATACQCQTWSGERCVSTGHGPATRTGLDAWYAYSSQPDTPNHLFSAVGTGAAGLCV
eukprot:2355967-Rhodomonas_salina.2